MAGCEGENVARPITLRSGNITAPEEKPIQNFREYDPHRSAEICGKPQTTFGGLSGI
jgi:hypothetical protein